MKVEVKKLEDLTRELSVEVDAGIVKEKLDEKFAEVRRSTEIKGFRKGKVPMDMIKSMFERDVKIDVADELIQETLPKAITEQNLKIATTPSITAFDYTDNGTLTYAVKLEVFPVIENVNYDGLKITSIAIDANDSEVDELVNSVRKGYAEHREVDRAVQDGDIVVADLHKVHDPNLILEQDDFPNSIIDLNDPMIMKEFREHLPGMNIGDEKDIEITYAKDHPNPDFAGAQITYRTKVKSVREQILPEFDDAFAKSTGQAETALELRMKIRDDIKHQKEDELRRHQKNEIVRQICEMNKIPIPTGLVNEYLDAIVKDVKEKNKSADEAEIRNNYQGVAINTLRWNLLYHHIGQAENIEVLPSDTEKAIKRFAENYNMSVEQARQALEQSGRVASIRDTILEEKVLDFLISKAEVVTKVEDDKENNNS